MGLKSPALRAPAGSNSSNHSAELSRHGQQSSTRRCCVCSLAGNVTASRVVRPDAVADRSLARAPHTMRPSCRDTSAGLQLSFTCGPPLATSVGHADVATLCGVLGGRSGRCDRVEHSRLPWGSDPSPLRIGACVYGLRQLTPTSLGNRRQRSNGRRCTQCSATTLATALSRTSIHFAASRHGPTHGAVDQLSRATALWSNPPSCRGNSPLRSK